jgi:hypothetical protein
LPPAPHFQFNIRTPAKEPSAHVGPLRNLHNPKDGRIMWLSCPAKAGHPVFTMRAVDIGEYWIICLRG